MSEQRTSEKRVCWACGATYTGPSNPSGKCPTCPDNDRPETPYELEMMATGQFPMEPYDVTCARCGKVLPCTEAVAEEGDEWECQKCNEICNEAERLALRDEVDEIDPYTAIGESPFGLPGGGKSL